MNRLHRMAARKSNRRTSGAKRPAGSVHGRFNSLPRKGFRRATTPGPTAPGVSVIMIPVTKTGEPAYQLCTAHTSHDSAASFDSPPGVQ